MRWRILSILLIIILISAARGWRENRISENLVHAAHNGDISLMRDIIQGGADINGDAFEGLTPLIASADIGDYEAVEFLVNNGADVNWVVYGVHPLLAAIMGGNERVVDLLVSRGATLNINIDNCKFIKDMARKSSAEIQKIIHPQIIAYGSCQ